MAINMKTLEDLIKDGVPDATVEIQDVRGDGEHYAAHVVSPAFANLTRIQQHQMVYKSLKGCMDKELHALQLSTAKG